ncbi:MAG: aspartyl-tRNA(Asn)/glutamyl-tRNA(Gln) amidotransferase subunit [Actinomycetota bacterium]|jgi:aspartyl-tRNA(Asn)/glutamyl-tRNA(Gln) amidotransferase subunit C|nr:aspartyl-tRNA(Asn)/glutamyl-tRNA(Gln) amidotransferase subunit [Actinomycetota bacterium]MDQ1550701.1 aspartyl-tRNA(Asn)/glutamyl-tRNA(Gln) amidotransferase subunit [Actinomycetota bacterium]
MSESTPAPRESEGAALTPDVVRHLAELARIGLTEDEIVKLTGELGIILASIDKVSEVATADVPGTSHPIPLINVYRDDVPGPTLTTAEALAGAPDHDGSRFRVTAILGEEQ